MALDFPRVKMRGDNWFRDAAQGALMVVRVT